MAGVTLPNSSWARPGISLIARALDVELDKVRLVGGAVRDGLAGFPVKDIDLATRFEPDQVIERLNKVGLKTVPTGLAHGTVSAVLDWGVVEITTLRRDVSTDGRRAVVTYSEDWKEDAARRDFTINALYADLLTGEIHDYFGGLDDLEQGRVRFIGNPLIRIAEDHLRIMRFFRFYARFGKGPPDPAGLAACQARANDLMALSRERIADELLKLLSLADPVPTIATMLENGIFAPILPEIESGAALKLSQLCISERREAVAAEPIRRLASLLPTDSLAAESVGARLKLSNKSRKSLVSLAKRGQEDVLNPRALAYWLGRGSAIDRLLLLGADLSPLRGWEPPLFPLSGKHVLASGVSAGPEVAAILCDVEAEWVREEFPDLGRLKQLLAHRVQKSVNSLDI